MMAQLKKIVKDISFQNRDLFLSPLTITLGDEFQSVVKGARDGINLIIRIEEEIIRYSFNLKLRYIFILGSIDTPINRRSAHKMYGEGLIRAREMLKELKKGDHRIHIDLDHEQSRVWNSLFFLYSSLVDKWKLEDYGLINEFLVEKDYYTVAKKLSLNRGTIWRKERSLGIRQYLEMINIIEELLELWN